LILICGDSFAADWTVKYDNYLGWPNLLAKNYKVKNIAQAGVGQYKILKQLQSVNIKDFDIIISSYTSPYRVHTYSHPIHHSDLLHKNCDLLANDIEYAIKNNKDNESLLTAKNYFKYHFDFDYYDEVYKMMVEKCNSIIADMHHIQISNLEYVTGDWKEITRNHKGLINHLSEKGNRLVYDKIIKMFKSKETKY
tara:strand:+ start:5111 stop:5695 length:585 start_codon:yes stop_codon:yes gene_type:complete